MIEQLLARLISSQGATTSRTPLHAANFDQQESDLPFEVLERKKQYGGWHAQKSTHNKQPEALPGPPLHTLPQHTLPGPSIAAAKPPAEDTGPKEVHKRANKNRPVEQSSKKPVPRLREVVQVAKKKGLDPRFAGTEEEPAAQHRPDLWRKRYSFVFDELLPEEQQELKTQIARTKNPDKKAALQQQLKQISGRMQSERDRRKQDERQEKVKSVQKEAIKAGKTPYYPKRSEKRKLELLEKYKELKASGKLEKYMERKRKRNAAKDRKALPQRAGE